MCECPICYKKANYTTECNHQFCKKCLYKWGKQSCPMCRRRMNLRFPQTRAMVRQNTVFTLTGTALNSIGKLEDIEFKKQKVEQVLEYIWENRIIYRKFTHLCEVIKKRAENVILEYFNHGYNIPEIFMKIKSL